MTGTNQQQDTLIKMADDKGSLKTFAGIRVKSMNFNAWHTGFTPQVFSDWHRFFPDDDLKTIGLLARRMFFEQYAKHCQFVFPRLGLIDGAFKLASMSYAGYFSGDAAYEMQFNSDGDVRFETWPNSDMPALPSALSGLDILKHPEMLNLDRAIADARRRKDGTLKDAIKRKQDFVHKNLSN